MAESFEIRPFEECIEKIKYTTKIASQDFKESGRFPIISQEEAFISGYWDNPEDVFHINKPVVIFGDHSRHIKYVDFDFVIGADGVKILSPVKSINAKYFYYFLKWLDIPSLGYSRHYKALKEKSVKVFSETCQQRIVDELDLLTGIIDKKNAQLRDLDALAQSIFYEMFGDPITNDKGWPKRMLKQLGLVITGNTPSTKDVKNYASEDVCFFKPSDICKDSVSFLKKSEFHISSYAFEKSRKLPKGSVLTTCIGIVGKVGILTDSATCNQQINAIIPENVESPWLAYAVFLQKKLMEEIANAPVVPIINKGDFSRIQVPVPPIEKQEQFSQALKEIECQKLRVRQRSYYPAVWHHISDKPMRNFDYLREIEPQPKI